MLKHRISKAVDGYRTGTSVGINFGVEVTGIHREIYLETWFFTIDASSREGGEVNTSSGVAVLPKSKRDRVGSNANCGLLFELVDLPPIGRGWRTE